MVRLSKLIHWTLYILGGLAGLLVLVLAVLMFVKIKIDVSGQKGMLEYAATRAIGRTVNIDGKILLSTSLQPFFALEGLRISNPEGFKSKNFAEMKTTRLQLKVVPLLLGKIHIDEITVKGLALALEENQKGAVNWTFGAKGKSVTTDTTPLKSLPQKGDLKLTSDSLVLTNIDLKEIAVSYWAPGTAEPAKFKIDECSGAMHAGQPFKLSLEGSLLKQPYAAQIEISALKEFLENSRSHMKIKGDIVETRFEFSGGIDLAQQPKTLELRSSVHGNRLNSLNNLLRLDLPPLKSYKTSALLSMQKRRLELSELLVQVGSSQLVGQMSIDNLAAHPVAVMDLKAPLIQLNDFDTGDWSPEKGAVVSSITPVKDAKKPPADPKGARETPTPSEDRKLLSSAVLDKFDVTLNLSADKVMSGKDEMGSGVLKASLKDGRFAIDPLQLNIPGGRFEMAASLTPDPQRPEATVRTVMKDFDFGVLVRRANPQAKLGGIVSLDFNLTSSAGSFDGLMAGSSGYLDFSARLENLEAGIIDLWAVNVLSAIASKGSGEQSQINCAVGRWTMNNGILRSDVFVIDTSKIRICANGQVDFKKKRIDLEAAPTPKRPEFFSLATPLQVQGSFTDFGMGVQPGGLFGTAINVVTSPIITPIRKLAGEGLPADGADVCGLAIGPDNRSTTPPAGCK